MLSVKTQQNLLILQTDTVKYESNSTRNTQKQDITRTAQSD